MQTPKPNIVKGGKKLPKKESMKLIRKTNSKITNWTINKTKPFVIEDDWSDNISISVQRRLRGRRLPRPRLMGG